MGQRRRYVAADISGELGDVMMDNTRKVFKVLPAKEL